jgi:hypothetical protein
MVRARLGFVSNSSSSSFIVFLPKNDKTINSMEEYKQYLSDEQYLDDEDLENTMKNQEDQLQQNFDKAFGLVEAQVSHGGEEEFEDFVEKIGGECIDMENF